MRTVLGPESITSALSKAVSTAASKAKMKTDTAAPELNNDDNSDVEGSDEEADSQPSTLTILAEAREALSQGMQLHLVTLLDESIRQSRRRRNRSAISSYGTLLHTVLPSRHSQNPERYPMPEASTSMAMLFGPNMKFELSQQEQAAAVELKRINLEFEEGIVADMATDEPKETVTGKRKLDGDSSGGGSSAFDKKWFEREVRYTSV